MTNKLKLTSLALAIGTALASTASFANDVESEQKIKNVERIAVVGSRTSPRSVADSPVPIDIIGGDELGKSGSGDMLDQLSGTVPSLNVQNQPISDAATLIRPVNLRGLSSDSTLILVNGKRRHRASVIAFQGGGINDGAQGADISVIPSVALKQVEVLRDGAAAQYGSDAIAGVMNFVLKDDNHGGSISVRQGEYYEGDGNTTILDGNVGMPLTDDGFLNLSFQYKNADATSRSVQRSDVDHLIELGYEGFADPVQIWGNPEVRDDFTIFANSGIDIGDEKEVYAFGNYSSRDVTGGFYYRNPTDHVGTFTDADGNILVADTSGNGTGGCSNVAVQRDANGRIMENIFDAGSAYQQMMSKEHCTSLVDQYQAGFTPQFGGNIEDMSLAMGIKGDINSGFLEGSYFDISGVIGQSHSTFYLYDSINPSLGTASPTNFETGQYIQLEKTFNAELSNELDFGLHDIVNVIGGIEVREETFTIVEGDEASWVAGDWADQGFGVGASGFPGFGPESAGKFDRMSYAAYIDAETFLTDDLLVAAALRYENFDSFGGTLNYKLTTQYSINDELSLRGSHSTGFRAPTVGQANVVNTSTTNVNGKLTDSSLYPSSHIVSQHFGAEELTPEESISYTLGAVYTLGALYVTADYYHIQVTDRISQSDNFVVTDKDREELAAKGVENTDSLGTVRFFANDFDTTTQGIDFVVNYADSMLNGDTLYSFAYNWNDTTVDNYSDATGDFKARRLEEALPRHRANFTIAQNWNAVSAFVRFNYFGEYLAVHADSDDEAHHETADAAITVDAQVAYRFDNSLTLSVGATNLFNKEAQHLQEGSDGFLGAKYYESGPYDFNGGFYYAKAEYSF